MSNILKDLAVIIEGQDKPNQTVIRTNNIKIGLRNLDGTGVVAGLTTKGTVIGYKKTPESSIKTNKPSAEPTFDPASIYKIIHGSFPTPEQLEDFIPKLKDLIPYDIEPVHGRLLYSGVDMNEIIKAHERTYGYEETAYLLLTGQLPNRSQLKDFSEFMRSRRYLSREFKQSILTSFTTSHMMNSLQLAVQSLYEELAKEGKNPDSTTVEDVTLHSIDIIAKFPILVAYIYHSMQYKYNNRGLITLDPISELDHTPNFLHMLYPESFTQEQALLLDKFLILHAEHGGGNNSTFTVRTVSSSETDTYSAINAGLSSLKGHLHGGANEKVVVMLEDIKRNVKNIEDEEQVLEYLCDILRGRVGDKSGKIYGIGHAVYTLSDPRAVIMREYAKDLAFKTGRESDFNLLELVAKLSPEALKKLKNNTKPISPNVDFYSGFILQSINIPVELFTPLFAAGRVAGWCAHRLEQLVQNKIMRPAYFNAAIEKPYILIDQR